MPDTRFTKISQRDLETRAHDDDHNALRLWLRLLSSSQLIENNIRELLRTEFDFTLPRFDLMAQLHRHPEGLSMSSLAEMMMVSGGNVTNIVKQLESSEFVKRTPQPADNRSFIVTLTKKGQRAFDRMMPQHEGWIVSMMDGLDSKDIQALMDGLDKLKSHIKSGG